MSFLLPLFNCNLHFVSNHFTNLLIVSILESISENENDLENREEEDSYKEYFRLFVPFGADNTAANAKILEIINNNNVNEVIDDEISFFNQSSSKFKSSFMKILSGFVDSTKQKKIQARSYHTEFDKWIGRSNEER